MWRWITVGPPRPWDGGTGIVHMSIFDIHISEQEWPNLQMPYRISVLIREISVHAMPFFYCQGFYTENRLQVMSCFPKKIARSRGPRKIVFYFSFLNWTRTMIHFKFQFANETKIQYPKYSDSMNECDCALFRARWRTADASPTADKSSMRTEWIIK